MRLVRDAESFGEPLDRAIDGAVDTVIAAGLPVRGSAARDRAALQEKQDLEAFVARVGALLAVRGFADLPRLRRSGRVVPHCHALKVGPWRGVFLVDPAGEFAVGLLFSKAPHLLDDRFDELVRRSSTEPDTHSRHRERSAGIQASGAADAGPAAGAPFPRSPRRCAPRDDGTGGATRSRP